jgi:hypothetical protein
MNTLTEIHDLKIHDLAVQTLARAKHQSLAQLEAWLRWDPTLATIGVKSLSRLLVDMMGTGLGRDTNVYRDDDLSLYVTTESGIVYGMIWHPRHYRVMEPIERDHRLYSGLQAIREGRYCWQQTGTDRGGVMQYCQKPYTEGKPACEGHDPDPVVMPIPGEWSFHS